MASYLRDGITDLALPAGTPLVEREIGEATTASRTTVREALRQLEAEGLVQVDPGRGAFVKQLTRREVLEIYAVRAQLEGLLCTLFAENASDEQLVRLREAFEAMKSRLADPRNIINAKEQFYAVLYEGADNMEAQRLLQGLGRRIRLCQATSLSTAGRPQKMLEELGLIVDALERRDAEAARARCIEHIESAATTLMESPDARFV
ncbi:GntR family transcriptional regulator [Arthrobacter sp. NPDC055138]